MSFEKKHFYTRCAGLSVYVRSLQYRYFYRQGLPSGVSFSSLSDLKWPDVPFKNCGFMSGWWTNYCALALAHLSFYSFYVPETHIMYFIRRCWFLKCSEEIHYVPIGAGDMWYYVPVDDGWEEVLGCNVYITSQYFSPNAKYWTASSGNRTRAPPDRMWTLYHWAMESVQSVCVLVIHYVPVLLSKC